MVLQILKEKTDFRIFSQVYELEAFISRYNSAFKTVASFPMVDFVSLKSVRVINCLLPSK